KALPIKSAAAAETDAVRRRLRLAEWRDARRLVTGTLAAALFVAAVCLYWRQVVARPLARSDARRVTLSADGEVRLPGALTVLADGRLHRFEWLADDGKIVRFFVINRFAGTASPTVVFDACMLCGDMGYAQTGTQVVCIACGVRIHPPSIGNAGGCNPIPMKAWGVENGAIVIPQAALDEGARYFTEYEKVSPSAEKKPCCRE
ncbi:MAG: Fe-S-containing protein, partial [Verrucomicrobiales bacterium]|nr:Fe-S-containing protein [Verrucomicrobiales bacterium]